MGALSHSDRPGDKPGDSPNDRPSDMPGDMPGDRPRGILHGDGAPERFELSRHGPSHRLREFVDSYWSVGWNLPAGLEHRQEILPHPCIQLVVEKGRSGVFGVGTGKSTKVLCGRGHAFGVKFWPGAFYALHPRPISDLSGARLPLEDAFGVRGRDYERAVLAAEDDHQRVALAEAFLAAIDPKPDSQAALARRIVESIAADRNATVVDDIARDFDLSIRSLQRLFHRYVGVTPKWVVQRYRMHEAVEELESGRVVCVAALAARLNYCDQAHFTRDFTRLVGRSPARYMEDLARGSGA